MNDFNVFNKLDFKCMWNIGLIEMKIVVIEFCDNIVCDYIIF